nr:MAG TPA: hypothetical protein [Caudoviricetes sp.]
MQQIKDKILSLYIAICIENVENCWKAKYYYY